MYARKEAGNELPGSRTVCIFVPSTKIFSNFDQTDLYALFRALSLPNIVTMFEVSCPLRILGKIN